MVLMCVFAESIKALCAETKSLVLDNFWHEQLQLDLGLIIVQFL